jgi:inorganic pyrophosphatase
VATEVKSTYQTSEKGAKDSLEYRIHFSQQGKPISCWHEIPLYAGDGLLNFICEIPKESSAKMEVATDEVSTPIKQDVKKGKLRFYPYNINWNYGMLPQTWEDPAHANEELDGIKGDNDPVDVVEIGSSALAMGGVYRVKPLGVYAMIDDGELDWKIIAISEDDPKAAKVNDVEDVEREFPGELQKIMEWFRDYKVPDGKPQNAYGYNNQAMNKEFTLKVVEETHAFYNALKSGKRPNDEELSLI